MIKKYLYILSFFVYKLNQMMYTIYNIVYAACDYDYYDLCLMCSFRSGARCTSVVRTFAHGAIGYRIDPSWGEPIELFLVPARVHDWCNKGCGMC